MIAKGLHHGPAFQHFQPRGRLVALGSGGMAFPGTAPQGQSGRFLWGPGMRLQLKNLQLWAVEVFWTGLSEMNQERLSISDTGAELLLYQHKQAFVPHFPLFPPKPMHYSLFTRVALFTATEALAELSLGFVTAGEQLQSILMNSPPLKLRHQRPKVKTSPDVAWVFDFSVLPSLSFQWWVGSCQNLWQIRGAILSCNGKNYVGIKVTWTKWTFCEARSCTASEVRHAFSMWLEKGKKTQCILRGAFWGIRWCQQETRTFPSEQPPWWAWSWRAGETQPQRLSEN